MTKEMLASRIWAMANKLRGKVKASNYKDYILGMMFYKYISEKQEELMEEEGIEKADLADAGTLDYIRQFLGYAIGEGRLFSDWKALGPRLDSKVVNDSLNEFEDGVEPGREHVFRGIFGTLQAGLAEMGATMGTRDQAVRGIVGLVGEIPPKSDDFDVIGYIYEYLIFKFATDVAKGDGAFYTPAEASRLMSMIIAEHCRKLGKTSLKVYDPTSGSASLLITVGKEAGRYVDPAKISYYAQEKIAETFHLTRMNLLMKDIPAQNITVRNGDTLEDDWPFLEEPLRVDAVVSNPPYSQPWEPEKHMQDERFRKYGIAPGGKGDYAFLLHCLYHLEDDGIMGIVLPHGVLFRGDSEGQIRKNLLLGRNIETVIGMPANMFFATSIPTIIMILRKRRTSDDVLFVDASKCFEKSGKQNRLREQDIRKIFDAVEARTDIPGLAHLASFAEIEANDFNMNIPRYVSSDSREAGPDFAGLMTGRVPAAVLGAMPDHWRMMPGLEQALFHDDGDGYCSFVKNVPADIRQVHPGCVFFRNSVAGTLSKLRSALASVLVMRDYSGVDLAVLRAACEELVFGAAEKLGVVDRYDAYQKLMDVWPGIESDIGVMSADGLAVCRAVEPRYVMKKDVEKQDGWVGRVIGLDMVGSAFFKADYDAARKLASDAESAESEAAELFEGLDEDLKAACGGEKPKAADISRTVKSCSGSDEETLRQLTKLLGDASSLKKQAAAAEAGIDGKILDKMKALTDDEILGLLEEKWCGAVTAGLRTLADGEADRLFKYVDGLRDTYATTLADIDAGIASDAGKLAGMLGQLSGCASDNAAVACLASFLSGKAGGAHAG